MRTVEHNKEGRGLGGVLAVCAVIFFADASLSAVIPTFPFFASALGASLTMIGGLASASGLSTAVSSIPMGSLSDRFGRKLVMIPGMLCLTVTPILYTVSSSPFHLFLARLVLGVGIGSTFSIGFVYITELAAPKLRGLAQGLYMTSSGLGFTLGPLVGGISAGIWGYSVSYYLSGGLALVGLLIILMAPGRESGTQMSHNQGSWRSTAVGFKEVLTNPRIMAAGVANFFNSMMFRAIMTFYPLYGGLIGLDESQVGLSFTVRGLSSTVSRFPAGAAGKKVEALRLMAIGLGVSALTLLILSSTKDVIFITMVLGVQGVAFGVYLTAGNAYVTSRAPVEKHGTAIAVYSTFSNISGVFSPFILGAIAERWSLHVAFRVSALLSIAGMVLMLGMVNKGVRLESAIG